MRPLAFLAVLTITTVACSARRDDSLARPLVPAVRTNVVKHTPAQPLVRRGLVRAGAHLRLGFDGPGVLASVAVRKGDHVTRGQFLARVHAGEASASLRAAAADRARAADEVRVADRLVETGSIASASLSRARSELQIARAHETGAAEALSRTRLFAPISGVVLDRLADPGESVGAGATVLVIDDTERFVIDLGLIERDLARVKAGQPVTILVGDAVLPGSVTSVATAPATSNGLYPVEIEPGPLPSPRALRAGALVDVRFEEQKPITQIRAPLASIIHRRDKSYMAVVTPAPTDARIEIREVKIDYVEAREAVVASGLIDGDRIVIEGAQFLQNGQTVLLQDERRP